MFPKRFTLPNQWGTSARRTAVLLLSVHLSCFSLVHIMSFFPAHTVFLAQLPLAAQRFHMDACMRLISWTAAVVFGLSKATPSVIASGSGTCTLAIQHNVHARWKLPDYGCWLLCSGEILFCLHRAGITPNTSEKASTLDSNYLMC